MEIMDGARKGNVIVPSKWWESLPRQTYSMLDKCESSQPWFEVYKVEPDVYVFYEPGQFEEAISYLVLGEKKAALIDTGCGIGNINSLSKEFTDLPIMVINTHSHNDHIAQNYLFEEVALYDHPVAREKARMGCTHDEMVHLIAEGMTWKPLPEDFNVEEYCVPPFKVTRWLNSGDEINLGGRCLEVYSFPGHSPDSICLLDKQARLFWTGDIFYTGAIYTYLPGGDLDLFIDSYKKMISMFDLFDILMPSHNEPYIDKEILIDVLAAAEKIREGNGEYIKGKDGERRYNYERFAIITAPL